MTFLLLRPDNHFNIHFIEHFWHLPARVFASVTPFTSSSLLTALQRFHLLFPVFQWFPLLHSGPSLIRSHCSYRLLGLCTRPTIMEALFQVCWTTKIQQGEKITPSLQFSKSTLIRRSSSAGTQTDGGSMVSYRSLIPADDD